MLYCMCVCHRVGKKTRVLDKGFMFLGFLRVYKVFFKVVEVEEFLGYHSRCYLVFYKL